MAKILIVDDDLNLSNMIRDWLSMERNTIEIVHSVADGLDMLKAYEYDLIVLDWGLPDGSGIDICKEFRARGGQTPILLLTGKKTVGEKETGLDAGADDYLVKPFHMKELSARLRALLRRSPGLTGGNLLKVGKIELDSARFKVMVNGTELQLQAKEFSLLEFLMRYPDQLFNVHALLNRVWPSDPDISSEAVRQCIKRLRDKLESAGEPNALQTVRGVGYKIASQ